MNDNAIRTIVIAGGQAAGWIAAATVAHAMQSQDIEILVVEDPDQEFDTPAFSGLPQLLSHHALLEIKEREMMQVCQATFKLGTEYLKWERGHTPFFLPFAAHGANLGIAFHHGTTKARLHGDLRDFNDYSLSAAAARSGHFCHPTKDPGSILASLVYSMHLDANQYGQYMRAYSEHLGARRLVGKIQSCRKNQESGFLQALVLEGGAEIEGDLFIDCTGDAATLIGEFLDAPLQDWSHWLPANASLALATPRSEPPPPCTTVTAVDKGWIRQIPVQPGLIHELSYDSSTLADSEAEQVLRTSLGSAVTSDRIWRRSFQAGVRPQSWTGNCVALGFAAGPLPSLEICELQLVHGGAQRLMGLFPDRSCNPLLAQEFNRLTLWTHENIRDFQILVQSGAAHRQTPFWQSIAETRIPESLAHREQLFRGNGQSAIYTEETFDQHNWVSAYISAGIWPESYDLFLDQQDFTKIRSLLEQIRSGVQKAAAAMPEHETYLRQYLQG